jgi:hypothetical protein
VTIHHRPDGPLRALASAIDRATRRNVLPLLRLPRASERYPGGWPTQVATLSREPGVRQQL